MRVENWKPTVLYDLMVKRFVMRVENWKPTVLYDLDHDKEVCNVG